MNSLRLFALLFVISAVAFAADKPLASGTWGGPHLRMEVTSDGATLEFDCASATISGAIAPDSTGHFQVTGTFQPEGHGPTREGQSQPTSNAVFTGTVGGDSMQLEMKVDGQNEPQKYTLAKGQQGRLFKCK